MFPGIRLLNMNLNREGLMSLPPDSVSMQGEKWHVLNASKLVEKGSVIRSYLTYVNDADFRMMFPTGRRFNTLSEMLDRKSVV
jgi:hypothetical protein